jgi:hypothetical protein
VATRTTVIARLTLVGRIAQPRVSR